MVTCQNNQRRDKIKGDRTGTSHRNLAPERSLIARLLPLSQSPTSPDGLSLHATPPTRDIPRCQSVSRTDRHVTLAARPCIAVASAVSPLGTHCARSSTGWSAVRDPRRATGDGRPAVLLSANSRLAVRCPQCATCDAFVPLVSRTASRYCLFQTFLLQYRRLQLIL